MAENRSALRRLVTLVGMVLVAYPAWLAISEWTGATTPRVTAWGQTFLHWFIVPTGVLGILAAWSRRRTLAVVALVATLSLTISTFLVMRPYPVPTARPGQPTVTIAFANVYNNNRRATEVVQTLLAQNADVVAIAELTPPVRKAMLDAGADESYPHMFGRAENGVDGMAIWSRLPLSGYERRMAGHPALLVTVDVQGSPLKLFVVHPQNEGIGIAGSDWEKTGAEIVRESNALTGPTVVMGDFNATVAHPPLQRMLHNGYRDTHGWLGRGLSPSWPTDRWFPPLFRIDHAFVRGGVVPHSVIDLDVPGSDHRGFVATFTVGG